MRAENFCALLRTRLLTIGILMVSGFLIRTVRRLATRVSRHSGRLVLMGCQLMRIRAGRSVGVSSEKVKSNRFAGIGT